jgi:hypothetical protein
MEEHIMPRKTYYNLGEKVSMVSTYFQYEGIVHSMADDGKSVNVIITQVFAIPDITEYTRKKPQVGRIWTQEASRLEEGWYWSDAEPNEGRIPHP